MDVLDVKVVVQDVKDVADAELVVQVYAKRVVLGVVQLDITIGKHLIIIIRVVEDRRDICNQDKTVMEIVGQHVVMVVQVVQDVVMHVHMLVETIV